MAALSKPKASLTHRTRALNESESKALQQCLTTLKPIVVHQEDRIAMTAPILAQASCVRCHDVEQTDIPDNYRELRMVCRARRVGSCAEVLADT